MTQTLLACRGIRKSFRETTILHDIDLDIESQDRIGLVGANGAGKTTLAKILSGQLRPDTGSIIHSSTQPQIEYLSQSEDVEWIHRQRLHLHPGDASHLDDFMHVAKLLGLSVNQLDPWESNRMGTASGGESTKLALAQIWSQKPDLMILDEPTNHLDVHGIEWLVEGIAHYPGAILIISHDRYFLDQTVRQIAELDEGKLSIYKGNYTSYRQQKDKQLLSQRHAYETHLKQQARIEADIRQLKDWAEEAHRKAGKQGTASEQRQMGLRPFERAKAKRIDSRVKSQIKRLEKLRTIGPAKPKEEQQVYFTFDEAAKHGKSLVEARGIETRFGTRILFQDSSFTIQRGECVGIVGANGCGKTTLLKALMQQQGLASGEIWVSPSASIGYFSQDIGDLDLQSSVLQLLVQFQGEMYAQARTLFANMGFSESLMAKPISDLSYGQQVRLKLAQLILQKHSLLILDEPSNHLDLTSREQLETALSRYSGTMLLVTHDRYMLERMCSQLLVFENRRIQKYDGTYHEYLERKHNLSEHSQSRVVIQSKERLFVIENRIAMVLAELGEVSVGGQRYALLDSEFRKLLAEKRDLTQKL